MEIGDRCFLYDACFFVFFQDSNCLSRRILKHVLQLKRHVLVLDGKYLQSSEPRQTFHCTKIRKAVKACGNVVVLPNLFISLFL